MFYTLELPVDFHSTGRGVPCQPLETADPPELWDHHCSSCRGPVKQAHFYPLSQSILGSGRLCGLHCQPVKHSVAWQGLGPGLAESTPWKGLGRFFHCSVTPMTQLGKFWVLCCINCLLIRRTSRIPPPPVIWMRRFKTFKKWAPFFPSHTLPFWISRFHVLTPFFSLPQNSSFLAGFSCRQLWLQWVQMNVLPPCLFFSGSKVQR